MSKRTQFGSTALAVVLSLFIVGCGSGSQSGETESTPSASSGGLTADQLRNGIGPIRSVALEDVNEELAEKGDSIFQTKCSACHKLDARYVGPALGDVLDRRSPEFVMNMMLNPAEMVEKHPEVKALLAQFLTPMPNQNLTEADARAVLEYLRAEAADADESESN